MSYIAKITAAEGKRLLGGVREHQSSRFQVRQQALDFIETSQEANGERFGTAVVLTSVKTPEIYAEETGHTLDYTPDQSFTIGDRVELSPACDLWMQGAKYGTVRGLTDGAYLVRMDHQSVKRLQTITPDLLRKAR